MAQEFPYLSTHGTNYEIGYAVGEQFKAKIQEFFKTIENNPFEEYAKTAEGGELRASYMKVCEETYPGYLDEIRGLADGAGLPFERLFIRHIKGELGAAFGYWEEHGECSALLIDNGDTVALGMTDDGDPLMRRKFYVVEAHVKDKTQGGLHTKTEEFFTSVHGPGKLAGCGHSFNNSLAFAVNALHPRTANPRGIPYYVLARAMMSASSIEELEAILEAPGYGCATGFGVNVAWKEGGEIRLSHIEVSPGERKSVLVRQDLKKHMNDQHLQWKQDKPVGCYYHVNMYIHTATEMLDYGVPPKKGDLSSYWRSKRFESLPPPRTLTDMRRILGDTKDPVYPIYRSSNEMDESCTHCVAIFDFKKNVMDLYLDGNPAVVSSPDRSFQLHW